VYQLAKLGMLEVYYNFLDLYVDRRDFEPIQMDRDSNYIALSADRLEDDLLQICGSTKSQLCMGQVGRTQPGLYKLGCEGSRMIALCLSCCCFDKQNSVRKTFRIKDMSRRQNNITWQRFKGCLTAALIEWKTKDSGWALAR